jgi:hypothetical protein
MAAEPERKPGSNLGHSMVNWEEAFAYWAGLSESARSYQAVADRYAVSVRTVETHGRSGRWADRLQAIKAQAAEETDLLVGQARVERIGNTLRLIDATLIGYADKLRRGEVRMVPADLERLNKLHHQLGEELGNPPPTASEASPTTIERTPEHTAAVIEALRETGALEAFGLRTTDNTGNNAGDDDETTDQTINEDDKE